jgi:hypothetical protein
MKVGQEFEPSHNRAGDELKYGSLRVHPTSAAQKRMPWVFSRVSLMRNSQCDYCMLHLTTEYNSRVADPEDPHDNADDDQPDREAHPHDDQSCGARRQPPIMVRQKNLRSAEKPLQAFASHFALQGVLSLSDILI